MKIILKSFISLNNLNFINTNIGLHQHTFLLALNFKSLLEEQME